MHRRNSALRTLFVEGTTDQAVIRRVIGGVLPDEVSIWTIEQVEVDSPRQVAGGGNRQLVIDIVRDASEKQANTVLGLVDRNFDLATEMGTNLIQTAAVDLEFELISAAEIRAVVEVVCGRVMRPETLQQAIEISTKILLARRYGLHNGLEDCLAVPDFDTFISIDGNAANFDLKKFLARMDMRNRSATRWRNLELEIEQQLDAESLGQEVSNAGFHVFEDLFKFLLREIDGFPSRCFGDDWLGRIIRAQIVDEVAQSKFFVRVLGKLNSSSIP